MKIVATSDLHGFLPVEVPDGDVLLIAGDIVPDGWSGFREWNADRQEWWFKSKFNDWLGEMTKGHDTIIGIAGNHDFVLRDDELAKSVDWIYLNGETIEVNGWKFFGSPWVPTFGNWAYMMNDSALNDEWDKIPEDVDVIMTHGPIFGRRDYTKYSNVHAGSQTLRNRIDYGSWPDIKLHVSGHIHEGYGVEFHHGVIYANVSFVNFDYKPGNKPVVLDLED